jgi:hypothetical protein
MADDMDAKSGYRVAPEIRQSLPVAILLQVLLLIFSAFVLDGGWLAVMTLISIAIFWAWLGFMIFLHGRNPTHLDLLAIKWGFPAIWITAFYLSLVVGKFRGV